MSSSSSSSSNNNLEINVASLNIASAKRDEKGAFPLYKRLPHLKKFIAKCVTDASIKILCIQEIRPTGELTAIQVVREIHDALGPTWEFSDLKVNPSDNSFHRAIFWDSTVYSHLNTTGIRTANTREPHFPYLFTVSQFTKVNSLTTEPLFEVVNAHAPMILDERIDHWTQVREAMKPYTIVLGDFNKFADTPGLVEYDALFNTDPVRDFVPRDVPTFMGFEGDVDANGNLWNGSLDTVAVNTDRFDAEVIVVPTTQTPRVSDHFLITAKITYKNQ